MFRWVLPFGGSDFGERESVFLPGGVFYFKRKIFFFPNFQPEGFDFWRGVIFGRRELNNYFYARVDFFFSFFSQGFDLEGQMGEKGVRGVSFLAGDFYIVCFFCRGENFLPKFAIQLSILPLPPTLLKL